MLDQCLSVDVHRAGGDLVVGLQKFIGLIARTHRAGLNLKIALRRQPTA